MSRRLSIRRLKKKWREERIAAKRTCLAILARYPVRKRGKKIKEDEG